MDGRILIEDEASAKHVTGKTTVSRNGADLIRATTASPGKFGFFEATPATWRQVIQQVQGLLAAGPDDRGPGLFDQAGEPWDAPAQNLGGEGG